MSQYDLVVIGAGSGGVRAARMAAGFGARVAVIEDRYLGGTCVNVGCVPKKLYVYGSSFSESIKDAVGYGWDSSISGFDWNRLRDNKVHEISRLNGIYDRLLEGSGAELVNGRGSIVDSNTVKVGERLLSTKRILIATGGWPRQPEMPGIELTKTSNEIFDLAKLPKRILVVGGGYIAVEFAGIFAGLGVETTLSYRGPNLLKEFDREIVNQLIEEMKQKGVDVRLDHRLFGFERINDGIRVDHSGHDDDELIVDEVLMAVGRVPNTFGLGLENTQVTTREDGTIEVFDNFQTNDPSVFAVGDVTGSVALTPVALAEGMALAKHLFDGAKSASVDYDLIPTTIFSQPNIGTLGLSEDEVVARGLHAKVFVSRFKPMKHALSGRQEQSIFKLIVDADSDRILGLHMLAPDAGEILQGFAVALKAGATKADFDRTIGIHPTAAEEFVTMREPTRVISG
ncbi:MAG: glutathione-disulfide reductase [Gammaproteobacteria bacterium]|jgi:glutathione reductase (NADPH)|nr:glutathione-disulfide reductase [Gammaproteobacteria bacterium]NCW73554.1 glutathione-disulfide reductase [Gammaproteobacteria bacterium]